MSITLNIYQSKTELQKAHPEIKSFQVAYQIPRGQNVETVRRELQKRNIEGRVYQVGDFIWREAESISLCTCLKQIGDNGPCAIHGG